MQTASEPKHRIALRDNYLSAIGAAAFILLSFVSQGQILQKINSYGQEHKRGQYDTSLAYPTGCGVPTANAWLQNIVPIKNSLLYYDSCGHKIWIFDPSTAAWSGFSGTSIDTTSLSARINLKLNWADTVPMLFPYAQKNQVVLNALGTPSIRSDVAANRPVAGNTGAIFLAVDTKIWYRDNGAGWDAIGGSGGGGSGSTNISVIRTPTGDSVLSSSGTSGFIALGDAVNAGAFGPAAYKQLDSLHRFSDSVRIVLSTDSVFMGIKPASTGLETLYFQIKLPAGSTTNLGYTAAPSNGVVTSSTGTSATITLSDHTNAGLMSPGDKARIDSQVLVRNPPPAYGGAALLVSAFSGTVDTLWVKRDSLQGTQGIIATQDTSSAYVIINKFKVDSNWIKSLTGWGGGGGTSTLTNAHIFVGNGSNVATDVAVSGDATIANNGALTIANNVVTNAKSSQMPPNTLRGNNTGATANVADLTAAQVASIINSSIAIAESQVGGLVTDLGNRVLNNGASTGIKAGIYSARPAASTCNCYYVATDTAKLYYDNGSWITIGGGGGGGSLPAITNLSYRGKLNSADTILQYRRYNVLDFGIVGDGTTDNTTKLRALVALMPAAGGTLYFPAGDYLLSDSILFNKPIVIEGDGYKPYKLFSVNLTPFKGVTNILFNSATKNCFVLGTNPGVNAYPIHTLRDFSITNTASSTPTAGAGIYSAFGKQDNIQRVVVEGFYIDIKIESNNLVAHDVTCVAPIAYGMLCTSVLNQDAGGTELSHCHFYSGFQNPNTAIAIYHKGGGLLYVDYCDFNAQTYLSTPTQFVYDIYGDWVDGPTSDERITNCEFENFQQSAIYLNNLSGGRIYNIQIFDNQLGPYGATPDAGIVVKGCYNVQIDGNIGGNGSTSIPHPFIKLINDTTVQLGTNLRGSRFGSQYGWAVTDSVYGGEDIQRVPLMSQIPGAALGPNVLAIKANPNGVAGDSIMVQVPISSFTPSMGAFNNFTSYANGGSWTGYSFTQSAADATNPGLITTGAQTLAGSKILTSAIKSDGIFLGSSGSAGANLSIGAANLIPATATGTNNHGIGTGSLHLLTTGTGNIANGPSVLSACTTCSFNVAEGSSSQTALNSSNNTTAGYQTMVANNTGGDCSAFGFKALNASTGLQNSAFASKAGLSLSTGTNNTAIGYGALTTATTASFNTALGDLALAVNVSGNHTMGFGYEAGYYETRSNKFIVGDNITTYLIGGDFSTGQLCFNCNTTGTNQFALAASALVEFRGTTGGWLPNILNTTQQTALSSPATSLHFVNSDSAGRLGMWNGSKYICYATTDMLGSGGGSGVTTVGTFSGSSQTNGATISGTTITYGPADATNPGMVSTGAQTIAGIKTFNAAPVLTTSSTAGQIWTATNTSGSGGWAAAPTGTTPGIVGPLVAISDADYTVAAGIEHVVYTTTLTAARTVTLPAASSNTNRHIRIMLNGGGGFQWTITSVSGSIIAGAITGNIVTNIGVALWDFESNGTNWYVIGQSRY